MERKVTFVFRVFDNRIIKVVLLGLFLFVFSMGCGHEKNTFEDSIEVMQGMEHLYAGNTYGYYMDVYSEKSKSQPRTNIIELKDSRDNIYCMIENAGSKRKIALQFFVDYVQVPILIDGEEYLTHYIVADEKYSEELQCKLVGEFDEKKQHKLLISMIVSTDVHASDFASDYTSDQYSLAYDMILKFENSEELNRKLYDYTNPEKESNEQWSGVLVNAECEKLQRRLPVKEIVCNPGEKLRLQYHIGGYSSTDEVLMLLCLDMKQISINNQEYILLKQQKEHILSGWIEIQAPTNEGQYDLTGWVIKDPFSQEEGEYIPLDAIYRFTISVINNS